MRSAEGEVLTGPNVILTLKVAVVSVTALLLASLVALARGNYRLHGRINLAFFTLTLLAVVGLELVTRVLSPGVFDYFYEDPARVRAMRVHLSFSIPALALMPALLYTGLKGRGATHLALALVFAVLWTGTFVTGVFFLPHTP